MDLVERYIEAVKFWLPARLKEDVAAELKDDIRSEIEEAEREKGRPLTSDEVAALLKARGNPLYVASRYLPQHVLIGPELYPIYILVLKVVAAICLVPPIVIGIAWSIANTGTTPPSIFAQPFNSLLISFAVVTIIFAVIERKGINPAKKDGWNPMSLRPVTDHSRIKRSTSVGDIIANLVLIAFFLLGYLSITTYGMPPSLIIANGHIVTTQQVLHGHVTVSPEWVTYWQIIVVVGVVEIAFSANNLFHPYWTMPRIIARALIDLVKTGVFCWLLQSHVIRELVIQGAPADVAAQIYRVSEQGAEHARQIAALIGFFIAVTALTRLWHLRPKPATVAA
jgi:hypothetical protein